MTRFDAIVVGGGHNGLVSAAYLAKAGLRTLVLERRRIVGGSSITEEVWPGFRISRLAYACGLVRPQIIEDLQLKKFGYEATIKDPGGFIPFPDGNYIFSYYDTKKFVKEIERFSKRDAKMYPEYEKFWQEFHELVDPILLAPPAPISDLIGMFQGPEAEEILRKMLLMSAKDFLDEYFESEEVKATICGNAVIGTLAGPYTPGTAYVLGHHLIGDIDGKKGVWGFAKGGMGSISDSMARAAEHFGATIRTRSEVDRVVVKDGEAEGVQLTTGEVIESRAVLSNADPKRTFLNLVGPEHLDEDFVSRVKKIKVEGCVTKVNCALSELPNFKAYPGKTVGPQHKCTIDILPSLEYLERAYDDAKFGRPSEHPFLEMYIQSAVDETVAPRGKHTLSIFTQYTPYHLKKGNWDDEKEAYGERVIDTLAEYAPDIRKAILHHEVITPLDMEREFYLPEGNIFHMEITPDQMFSFRPVPGWSNYRTPIKGLYLCGSGAHPGGGVTGAPGYNAAMAVLQDLGKKSAA